MGTLLLVMSELDGWKFLLFMSVVYVGTSIWLFALFDVSRSTFRQSEEKVIWVQVVKSLPLVGALLYLAVGRNRKTL